MRRAKIWIGLLGVIALLVTPCLANGAGPTDWPLERIVANLEARLREWPDDAIAQYNLGRAHAFAFVLDRSSLRVYEWHDALSIEELKFQRPSPWYKPPDLPSPNPAERLAHLSEGVRHLRRACALGGKTTSKRYELTLAWLLETGAHLASRVDTSDLFGLAALELSPDELGRCEQTLRAPAWDARSKLAPLLLEPAFLDKFARYCSEHSIAAESNAQGQIDNLLKRYWLEQSIEHYRRSVEAVFDEINHDQGRWPEDDSILAEARQAYVRLVHERGFRDAAERTYVADLETRMADAQKLPPRRIGVTPVVVSLDGCQALDELTTPNLTVPFDLDGDGVDELWPWLAPDAGWLVWDPHHRGEITSGQQLFGSASGWLFFEDGYRALDALDDDRNGRLEGAELDGIAVWFDRNTNGVSDRGEVVPVSELGIAALSTQSTLTLGASPANLCGAELADGRVLPTYDWVLAPAVAP